MGNKFQIGVIGLGKFGFRVGSTVMELGGSAIGMDNDPELVRRAQEVFSQVYQADAMDVAALQQLGFHELSHVVVSVGDDITTSSILCMHLKDMGVAHVSVKAVSADHAKLLSKIGVHEVIFPEEMAARQLAYRLARPGFVDHLPFDPDMAIQELVVAKWAGKTLRDLDLTNRFHIQVIATAPHQGERFHYIPSANHVLAVGEILVIIGPGDRVAKLTP
jgi:trk system potassium uptake protein